MRTFPNEVGRGGAAGETGRSTSAIVLPLLSSLRHSAYYVCDLFNNMDPAFCVFPMIIDKATGFGLDGPLPIPNRDISLFSTAATPPLGPIQLRIQ
jgi:hypothetical protein